MGFYQAICVALVAGLFAATSTVIGHWFLTYLQRKNEERKHQRERLHERYSELVAIATDDIERAKTLQAMIALSGANDAYPERAKRVMALENQRRKNGRELTRVFFQTRLLERDKSLIAKIKALVPAQPFLALPWPPQMGKGSYNERFDAFQKQIREFEQMLGDISDAVVLKHSA
jgi:hypothetical protein